MLCHYQFLPIEGVNCYFLFFVAEMRQSVERGEHGLQLPHLVDPYLDEELLDLADFLFFGDVRYLLLD